jgi:hypothetical protein
MKKTTITFSTLVIAAVTLLSASGPALGNQQVLAANAEGSGLIGSGSGLGGPGHTGFVGHVSHTSFVSHTGFVSHTAYTGYSGYGYGYHHHFFHHHYNGHNRR